MLSVNIILLIVIVGASFYAWNKDSIFQNWLMIPYKVKNNKQWYRFITSGFIHKDHMHLAFNALTLYMMGSYVEAVYTRVNYGAFNYVALFLLGVIVSDIPTFLKQKDNPAYSALGASGGVSAVVFAFIILFPTIKLNLFFLPIGIPGFIFGGIYLIYSHQMAKKSIDHINHDAHLYGSLFGAVYTLLTVEGAFTDYFLYGIGGIMNWR